MLSDEFFIPSVSVRKVYGDPFPRYIASNESSPQGTIANPALPANCALNLGLQQSRFGAKSNGRIFIPGVPENQTTVGVANAAYLSGPVTAFVSLLINGVNSETDTGAWVPGVISTKVLNAAPPAKDWPGAFAQVSAAMKNPVLAFQRRRTTRVLGSQAA